MRQKQFWQAIISTARFVILGLILYLAVHPAAVNGVASGKVAFSSNRSGKSQIYLMNADGTDQVNISNNAFNEEQPSWSPDGSKIAFVSDRDGNGEICVMNADGSNQQCLTNNRTTDGRYDRTKPEDR